jgi:8-oxo-dGTP pyrophosphatase MutT (NUDIX family)/2-phospho-L-lactate transferase/gluconeogenesis factor (CofD/UPF0052 family)
MHDEKLQAFDNDGKSIPGGVSRLQVHRYGVWHRAVSIFVLNEYGEILLEKRSPLKDLFPGLYDIPGGHLKLGQSPLDAACAELEEELGIHVEPSRLTALCAEDQVIERFMLPERSIINLERKTIYLIQITREEEENILGRSAEWAGLSAKELEEKGATGEVSHVELWSWMRLQDALNAKEGRKLASGTEFSLSYYPVRSRVSSLCADLRNGKRWSFWNANRKIFPEDDWQTITDERLFETFLEKPSEPASKDDVEAAFELGRNQPSGAYQIGRFRLEVSGDGYWGAKLRDPATNYVDNLLKVIARDPGARESLLSKAPEIQTFVWQALNLPMANGNRFRDELGNLVDIAVARKAALVWLEHNAGDILSKEDLLYPTRALAKSCIEAGRTLLAGWYRLIDRYTDTSDPRFARLEGLFLRGLGAASVDFNNPRFQKELSANDGPGSWITEFIQKSTSQSMAEQLGGVRFLKEFIDQYVGSSQDATLTFLPGSSAQAYFSLAICQELLKQAPGLRILFAPKAGTPGSDLNLEDAQAALVAEAKGMLAYLAAQHESGRFSFVPNGPTCHGLDPARLSRDMGEALSNATVIIAEGQAYAEIRGWKKPTFVAFRVNGRVAEAIHGVSRRDGACAFVRLTPGVDHFEDFEEAVLRSQTDRGDDRTIPMALQTTSEYVEAIAGDLRPPAPLEGKGKSRSDDKPLPKLKGKKVLAEYKLQLTSTVEDAMSDRNLPLLIKHIFQDDRQDAIRHIRAEARRLGKTFVQVVLGVAARPPDPNVVRKYYDERTFPVFACGGGGGFNGVTLKALKKLDLPVAAGVPSTDDGGNSGELQKWLREKRGFVFGVGDMAGVLQDSTENKGKQAILAYRFDHEPTIETRESLAAAVLDRIHREISNPTYADSPIRSAPDFLSFVCDQLNLARIIDRTFRTGTPEERLPVKKASIRNLNVIAACELCKCLGDRAKVSQENRLAALYVLEKAIGATARTMVLPVTNDECVLYLEYDQPVDVDLAKQFKIPPAALQKDHRRLFGQQYIDKLPQRSKRKIAGVAVSPTRPSRRPKANPEYLARLRGAKLFVMGAGSLISSQLSQLAVEGVLETLMTCRDMRKILVINHVKLDETFGMTLREQIQLIERVATKNVPRKIIEDVAPKTRRLRIGDIFTDVIVPRTVAREVESEMIEQNYTWNRATDKQVFVELSATNSGRSIKVLRNRYVDFLLDYPSVQAVLGITLREIDVLSCLEQPCTFDGKRTEIGRYRGALFATKDDINYMVRQGIQRRNIHEVDSIGENWKILKAEGEFLFEFFPGLVPDALTGIFRIALERGSEKAQCSPHF